LEKLIKESGHQWGFGFYVETTNGEVFYKQWHDSKSEDYNKTNF
jgi:hypothetical protein